MILEPEVKTQPLLLKTNSKVWVEYRTLLKIEIRSS